VIRWLALPRGWTRARTALAVASAMALCLALAPGELAPASLRAGAAAAAIGALALLARARLARPADARRLTLVSRQALSREAGVALLEVDGRPMLVGYGGGAVQLLEAVHPINMGERSAPLRCARGASAPPCRWEQV
jgi:flagellar protein FliO/FliZ